ncbi:MAG: insulinase family protein [Treponema sp.]|nr:insulinase family protein [Treponema sp.]
MNILKNKVLKVFAFAVFFSVSVFASGKSSVRISSVGNSSAAKTGTNSNVKLPNGKTEVPGLFRYELENGLELYVAENDSAPLVHIKITVLGGGIASTPETAGLFHLYEHMMFEGDSQYANNADMERATQDMGVLEHNAQTGINSVSYYFTVPSHLLEKGLKFWNYAIREPLLSEQALEGQKKVVISEIEGNFADPGRIYSYNLFKNMFPKFPWRVDAAGYPALVQKATVADLRAMLKKYYIPNNALLLVGGDVKHEEVYRLVKEIYGSWERGGNPWQEEREYQLSEPFEKPAFFVMPSDQLSSEQASIRVVYRGPDACLNSRDVEIGSFFDELMADPSGYYIQTLMNDETLEIPNPNYAGEGLSSMRENGLISFSCAVHNPKDNLAERTKYFYSLISEKIVPEIIGDKKIFTKAQYKQVKRTMKDYSFIGMETAEQLLAQVEYCWVNFSRSYFFTRTKKIKKSDIDLYLNRYIIGKAPLICVQVNPSVYEAQKEEFRKLGFGEFTIDSAYWWKSLEEKNE